MPTAELDPALGIRVLGVRELHYDDRSPLGEDRGLHVRAASGLAVVGGRLVVVQDDTSFIAYVSDRDVTAIPLPRGPGGRRRFEVGRGNKADKIDLEACVAVGDELWAFGSGTTPPRERIAVVGYETRLRDAEPLYRRLREEIGGPVNIEGVCCVGNELWLFHRGNTGPDDPGPIIIRIARAAFAKWLANLAPLPEIDGSKVFHLGEVDGVRLGFTDAVTVGARVFYLAAAEASPNAIDDGAVLACQLGLIDGERVRAAPVTIDGVPVKAEGLAFDPKDPRRGWISIDPDDPERPAQLCEIELVGPW